MYEWQKLIQTVVDEIDRAIAAHDDEALTLRRLAAVLGYSEFHATRKWVHFLPESESHNNQILPGSPPLSSLCGSYR